MQQFMDKSNISSIQKGCIGFTPPLLTIISYIASGGLGKFPGFGEMRIVLVYTPNFPFVLYVGTKRCVKLKGFEQFISQRLVIPCATSI